MKKSTPHIALLCCTIWVLALVHGCRFVSAWMTGTSRPILSHRTSVKTTSTNRFLASTPDDDDDDNWGLEDTTTNASEDPRLKAMRTMLESSWNDKTMGVVPSSAEKAAEAAADSVANAMAKNHNVVMIDLRLPSYDITEGPKLYDIMAASDFCSYLSDRLCEKNLIRKSLVLVRNEKERGEIERVRSKRDEGTTIDEGIDDDIDTISADDGGDNDLWGEVGDDKVDDFRAKLMDSWDTPVEEFESSTNPQSSETTTTTKIIAGKTQSSHRLWSMVGKAEISSGPDMFDQVIAAVDENAILSTTGAEPEDALIILSPYDTTDVIAIRRILARYGQTRTIVIVNSRMEVLPAELSSAVLVYGILPLIARSRTTQNSGDDSSGLKAVVMRRFPSKWAVYVDVYGDGFVEASNGPQDTNVGSSKEFPSPEYIAKAVQKHVEGLK
jgi:hypothetical protein